MVERMFLPGAESDELPLAMDDCRDLGPSDPSVDEPEPTL